MSKYTITVEQTIKVKSNGKVRFSEEFQEAIGKVIASVLDDDVVSDRSSTVRKTDVEVSTTFCPLYMPWHHKLRQQLDLLIQRGKDYDVLELLLDKYPELKGHPRVNELVGTFDMLAAKAQELIVDTKSTPRQTTAPMSKPGASKQLSKEDLIEDREKKLLGSDPGQRKLTSSGNRLADLVTNPEFIPKAGYNNG